MLPTKALASKLARASYYVLKNDVDYNPAKVFERFKAEAQELELALIQKKGRGSKPSTGTGSGSQLQNQKPTA